MNSVRQKLICIEREVMMRKKMYPRWVAQGKKSLLEAKYEIDIMQEIAQDYRDLLLKQQSQNQRELLHD